MDFKLIVPRSISLGHCPKCDTIGSLDRVKNDNIYDKILLRVFQIRSYHCRECKWIGRFLLYKIRNNPIRVLSNYMIIAIIFTIFLLLINIMLKR